MRQTLEGRGTRPYKVWDGGRQIRKGLVASSFAEFVKRGREKLELGEARVRVVLEADGTQVEDQEYFYTLPANTVFLLLRQGEHWYPAGVEVLRQGTSSPRRPSATARVIVSGIGETPQRHEYLTTRTSFGSTPSPIPGVKSPLPSTSALGAAPVVHGTVTTVYRDGKKETLINDVGTGAAPTQEVPVINHEGDRRISYLRVGPVGGMLGRLSRQGSSVESGHAATMHIHTPECYAYGHPPQPPRARASPTGEQLECDFHCYSLHEDGGRIRQYAQPQQISKTVATSPIQDIQERRTHLHPEHAAPSLSPAAKQHLVAQKPSGSHVRFLTDHHTVLPERETKAEAESSESETENTTNDEDGQTCEKFLLLIDQPSAEQKAKKHLTIRDIGVILDRLSSKIIDVERLDRDSEDDCYNWTIKAIIRGDSLRELGVLYGGHYYTICEHPAYGSSKEEEGEEEEGAVEGEVGVSGVEKEKKHQKEEDEKDTDAIGPV